MNIVLFEDFGYLNLLPLTWLRPETSGGMVRFVDTQFDAERTVSEARRVFPGMRDIAVEGMPLRSIFITLARRQYAAESR